VRRREEDKAIWIEIGWRLAMGWRVLEGGGFRCRDRNPNFEGKNGGQELVTGVEERSLGVGQGNFWGNLFRRMKRRLCGSKQRQAFDRARRDRRTCNGQMNCSPMCNGQTAHGEGQRGLLEPLGSRRGFITPQPTWPFVREVTLPT
jgi:hypothetical protein